MYTYGSKAVRREELHTHRTRSFVVILVPSVAILVKLNSCRGEAANAALLLRAVCFLWKQLRNVQDSSDYAQFQESHNKA